MRNFSKKLIAYLLLLGLNRVFSQQPAINLVPNPSFEYVISSGFSCPGDIDCGCCACVEFDWDKVLNWRQPDYTSWAAFVSYGLGDSRWQSYSCDGWSTARTGSAWAYIGGYIAPDATFPNPPGGNYGYVSTDLNQALISGNKYYVSFYTNNTMQGYGIRMGAYFTHDEPEQFGSGRLQVNPEFLSPFTTSTTYDIGWVKMSGIITATDDYDWVTIGTFDEYGNGYNDFYWIDDVTIIDLGNGSCPPQWLIENTTYNSFQSIYEASNRIDAGTNVGFSSDDGPVVVTPGSNITYKAGSEIGLRDGFSAWAGSIFHAYISPCGVYCPSGNIYSFNLSTGNGVLPGEEDLRWTYGRSPIQNYGPSNVPLKRLVPAPSYSGWVTPDGPDYDWIYQPDLIDAEGFIDEYHVYALNFNVPDASLIDDAWIDIDKIAADNSVRFQLNGQPLPALGDLNPENMYITNFSQIHDTWNPIYYTINSTPIKDVLQTGNNQLTAYVYTKCVTGATNASGIPISPTGLMLRAFLNYGTCEDNQISIFYPGESKTVSSTHQMEKEIRIFPNPNEGVFTVELYSGIQQTSTCRVLDLSGNQLITQVHVLSEGVNSFNMDLSQLSNGMYFIEFSGINQITKVNILK
jgi:hypothetical protein